MAGHDHKNETLLPYLSPAAVWALSVGTSVGWGALVVTSTGYLSHSGPLGTVLGLVIGGLLMLLIGWNFHYMANRYPDAGGIYAYTKNVFGYDVYLGEALLTLAAIGIVTLLCLRSKQAAARVMVVLVLVFTVGIAVCFALSMARRGPSAPAFEPAFVPDRSALRQVLRIVFISPWAFIGFENVTHSTEEFNFKVSRLYRLLVASVVTSTALYIFHAVFTRADALMYERKQELKRMGAQTRE